MKISPRWLPVAAVWFVAGISVAQAHPGHDGGHELTWDFDHLAAHPAATIMCLATIFFGGWVVARLASVGAEKLRRIRSR